MSPTIYDIARVAGVSKSTVSRVLNKQTNISPEAREKVLRAIEELQYQPNKLARALTSSGFDAIMVISTRSTKTSEMCIRDSRTIQQKICKNAKAKLSRK